MTTVPHFDTTTIDALDFDPELPCEYGPPGRVICESGQLARWRIAYGYPCGCYPPQLICDGCLHRYRLLEIKVATLLRLGHIKCVHCAICLSHIDWQPATVTPLPGACP